MINRKRSTVGEEDYNRFLNDNEARNRLLEIRDNISIRDLSRKYNNNNKRSKKTSKFSFNPKKIILMRKRGTNKIPAEGRAE